MILKSHTWKIQLIFDFFQGQWWRVCNALKTNNVEIIIKDKVDEVIKEHFQHGGNSS